MTHIERNAPEHHLALPKGTSLEGYHIGKLLGEGGFGITYLAVDIESGKQVAIKELLPKNCATRRRDSRVVPTGPHAASAFAWALESFTREARTLARLAHPNVVPIHRLFRANGTAYMVMDYVQGESMLHWLKRNPRSSEDQLRGILMPLLDGLEHVHAAGLLHRDIKPANIFITESQRPVLLDFGSARPDAGETQVPSSIIYSEGFSPFELYQRKSRQNPASDLYALAATMVMAITGKVPVTAIDRSVDSSLQAPVQASHAGLYGLSFLKAMDAAFAVRASDRPQSVAEWRKMLQSADCQSPVKNAGPLEVEAPAPSISEMPEENLTAGTSTALESHPLALPPGASLEGYLIERVLGHGGMGITYLAVDKADGRRVAIKELLPASIATRRPDGRVAPLLSDRCVSEFVRVLSSLRRDGPQLAGISHPNLVRYHRMFEANGTACLVMDLVEGETFEDWLKKNSRPNEAQLGTMLMTLLDGLQSVHDAGLLHRDIKPEAIHVTPSGIPVLMDFGMPQLDSDWSVRIFGNFSPGYTPLERYRFHSGLTPATDLYGLAATMIRAITGEIPASAIDRLEDDSCQNPLAQTHARLYGASFLHAIEAGFALHAADRPQSVSDWRDMLEFAELPCAKHDSAVELMKTRRWPEDLETPPAHEAPGSPDRYPWALPRGFVLEGYRLEYVLDNGPFGVVYLATESANSQQVALSEFIPPNLATRVLPDTRVLPLTQWSEECFMRTREQFLGEARRLANLTHPNFAQLRRTFEANGTVYLVMEHPKGETLNQWLARHPTPSEADLRHILMPLLDALQYIHNAGNLHGSITPEQICITTSGQPVLLNLSLARIICMEGFTELKWSECFPSAYFAFEQFQQHGRQIPATDLYAMAACMIRAITGKPPASAPDRLVEFEIQPLLSTTHQGRYSSAFLSALDAAFAVRASDRPQSVGEWRDMLEDTIRKIPGARNWSAN